MFLALHSPRKDGKHIAITALWRTSASPAGAWCSDTCCIWARSTIGRNWRGGRSIEVFEDGAARAARPVAVSGRSLRGVADDARSSASDCRSLRLRRPRQWGACWLTLSCGGSGARSFWSERLASSRKGTRWDQVLFVLVAYRLLAPGSEWRLHREWFGQQCAWPICWAGCGLAEIHKLYDCHDRLLKHKQAVFDHLVGLARSVQRQLRRAALRSDVHLFRVRSALSGRGQAAVSATRAIIGRIACR